MRTLCREKVAATVLIRKVRQGPMRIDPSVESPGCCLGQELSRPTEEQGHVPAVVCACYVFSLPGKRTYKHLRAVILARQSRTDRGGKCNEVREKMGAFRAGSHEPSWEHLHFPHEERAMTPVSYSLSQLRLL